MLKANFWLVAMACGCFQVLQAMSNGAAVKSGIGAIWVGAMSATVSMLALILTAVALYRLPFPDAGLVMAQGMKVVAGGLMGGFIVAGLAFVAPQTRSDADLHPLLLCHRSRIGADRQFRTSGNGSKAACRRDNGPAFCSPVLASCWRAPDRGGPTRLRPSSLAQAAAARLCDPRVFA